MGKDACFDYIEKRLRERAAFEERKRLRPSVPEIDPSKVRALGAQDLRRPGATTQTGVRPKLAGHGGLQSEAERQRERDRERTAIEKQQRLVSTQPDVDYSNVRRYGARDVRAPGMIPLSITQPRRKQALSRSVRSDPSARKVYVGNLPYREELKTRGLSGTMNGRKPAPIAPPQYRPSALPRGRGRAPVRMDSTGFGERRHPGPIRATTQAEALARAFRTR